jgi:hypothetical protein
MMTSGIESKYFPPLDPGETPQMLCTSPSVLLGSSGAARLCAQALASVQAEPTTCLVLMQAACLPSLLEYSTKGKSHIHDLNVSEP